MLTTYDRVLREYKRGKAGALLTYKPCKLNAIWCHVCRRVAASMELLGKALNGSEEAGVGPKAQTADQTNEARP